jgi:ankyrin repeat protein
MHRFLKSEIFQLLVDLAQKDRALAVRILGPLVGTHPPLTISQTLNYNLPELIGLLVEAGANIHERNNNGHDLLELAIQYRLSLTTIEAMLKAFAAAGVPWNHDFCLNFAMENDSVPLAGLLLAYDAKPSIAVETWFFEHAD